MCVCVGGSGRVMRESVDKNEKDKVWLVDLDIFYWKCKFFKYRNFVRFFIFIFLEFRIVFGIL